MRQPFTILHVCLGNICRSPMAERIMQQRWEAAVDTPGLLRSVSAGTGNWHVDEDMHHQTRAQLGRMNVATTGFRVRQITPNLLNTADLILVAGTDHLTEVQRLAPGAAERTFLLRQAGRIAADIDPTELPEFAPDVASVAARGDATTKLLARRIDDVRIGDELDDPWGYDDATFARVAAEIDTAVSALVTILAGRSQ